MSGFRLRHPLLWGAAFAVLGAVAIVVVVSQVAGRGESGPDYPYPVQTFADQGREHLKPGETFDGYNSNPPTSGPHAPAAAPWGVSDVELPKEAPVHNMEHGGVVIWYNCAAGLQPLDGAGCQQLRDELAAVVNTAMGSGKMVLMTSYAGMDHRIALTAWRNLDSFDEFDQGRVEAFIAAFERRFNPEGF